MYFTYEEVVDLVQVVVGDDVDVGGSQGGLLALSYPKVPGFDVQGLGEDRKMEHEVGQVTNAVRHVEGKRVCALIGDRLDVVEAALVNHRL